MHLWWHAQRDGEFILLEIQGIHPQCYEKMGIKKNLLGLVLGIDIPSPPPTVEKDFPLAKWQHVSRPSFSESQQMNYVSLFCCHGERISLLLMSNLGFSLRYLPFGRPACCCSTGTVSWPRQLLELCRADRKSGSFSFPMLGCII